MTDTASSTRETADNAGIITGGDFIVGGNVNVLISNNYGNKSDQETVFLTRKTGDPAQIRYKFCGNSRKAILGEIHESLQNSEKTSTILFGVDGMGKTTTGVMYWKIYAKQYKHLIWITGSSVEQIEFWFRKIAEILKLSAKEEDGTCKPFDTLLQEIYCNLLEPHRNDDEDGRKKCLLIFDDADLTIIQKYLPPEEISPAVAILIITNTSPEDNSSAFPGLSGSMDTIQLEEFNDDDISDYIEQNVVDKSGRSKEADHKKKDLKVVESEASKLKGLCGGFPLALYQVVTCINKKNKEYSDRLSNPFDFRATHYGISQFAADFENKQWSPSDCDISDNDDAGAAGNNQNPSTSITIFTVWNHILKKIKKSKFSGLALEILKTMQLLNCDSIPRYLICSLFPMKELGDSNDLSSAISLLCEYSVIQDHEEKYLSIHRVFQKLPLPVQVLRPEKGQFSFSVRNIVEGLMPTLLKLIAKKEYSRQMFEDKMRSFWKINLQQVYCHIANSAEANCPQPGSGSAGFSKDMFWSHGEHCLVSKSCVAVQLFTVLLGGVVVQELYQVLDGSPVKLNGHGSQQTLSEWVALKTKSNPQSKGSSSVKSEVRSEQKLLFELYSVITTIPNPPVQLMRNSLEVISLANEGHTKQGAGLKLLFQAFQTFLSEFKNIKFSPDIITKFRKILGVSPEDLITSKPGKIGTGSSSNSCTSSSFAFPWLSRLSKDKICKLKELVKLMAVELKSSSETAPENGNHRIFPDEFVEATEKFFMTVIEQQGNNIQDIYVWFVWQYNAFKIVAETYPGNDNDKLLAVLRNVTQIYESINDRTIVERLLSL